MTTRNKKKLFFSDKHRYFPIRAVLFDFDGVIADTMVDNFAAWQHAFREQKIEISASDYFPHEGHSTKEVVKIIGEEHDLRRSLFKRVISDKEAYYLENNKFRIYLGVKKLMAFLRLHGVVLGLVSGASPERLYKTLPKDFVANFEVIVHAGLIKKSKPHPSPYSFCIKKLGIPRERCIAVENAPLGIMSAKRAGLFCAAVCSTLPAESLKEADAIMEKISDFRHYLKAIE